jgi:hypothetical protein
MPLKSLLLTSSTSGNSGLVSDFGEEESFSDEKNLKFEKVEWRDERGGVFRIRVEEEAGGGERRRLRAQTEAFLSKALFIA